MHYSESTTSLPPLPSHWLELPINPGSSHHNWTGIFLLSSLGPPAYASHPTPNALFSA